MQTDKVELPRLFSRLIALWVISEAFAGGILHALKLPFTGMLVSGFAVCIIVLTGRLLGPSQILKATVIVCIFKLGLSPHSPPTAYLAVAFQGILGSVLIRKNSNAWLPVIGFGLLALTESAAQRLLVLWILYGETLWTAVNEFMNKTLGHLKHSDYAKWLTIGYVLLHSIAGIIIGIYAYLLCQKISSWKYDESLRLIIPEQLKTGQQVKKKNKFPLIFIIWLLLLVYALYILLNGNDESEPNVILELIIRSMLIAGLWFFVFKPVFQKSLAVFLNKKKKGYAEEICEVETLLPFAKNVFIESLRNAGKQAGFSKKISRFWKLLMYNFLFSRTPEKISSS